jgi:hypothetical protein
MDSEEGVNVMHRRLAWLVVVMVLVGGAAAIPSVSANTSAAPRAVLEECRERYVFVPGEEEQILERVPDRYELVRNAFGRPLLYVSAIRCERYTVDGTTEPTTVAAFAAIIESPDGGGCASRWPVVGDVKPDARPYCNLYLLFAAYDNPAVVTWGRAGVPDLPVLHVPDLEYRQRDLDLSRLGAPFHFRAGWPTPSPFELDAIVRERPVEAPITASFWFTGSSGTVRFRFESDNLAFGEADGTVRPAPGSEMAEMFGTETPMPSAGTTLFAGNRWRYGELTKELLPAGP